MFRKSSFKKSAEQQIIVEADKIASMKESFDALSWDRVAEIGKELQEEAGEDKRRDLARELVAISQANASLLGKLGITPEVHSGKFIGSGVEILEDKETGSEKSSITIDASTGKKTEKQKVTQLPEANHGSGPRSIVRPVEKATKVIPDLDDSVSEFFKAPSSGKNIIIPRGKPQPEKPVENVKAVSAFSSEDPFDDDVAVAGIAVAQIEEETPSEKTVSRSLIRPEDELRLKKEFGLDDVAIAELGIEPEVLAALLQELDSSEDKHEKPIETTPPAVASVSSTPVIHFPVAKDKSEKTENEFSRNDNRTANNNQVETSDSETSSSEEEQSRGFRGKQKRFGKEKKQYREQDLANFKQIYASRDGSLRVYRDANGHLVSVDSSKLA